MIKILHIGPTASPPMCHTIEQMKNHADFSHVIISNTAEKWMMPKSFFSDITIYVYDYWKDYSETSQMKSFLATVLDKEKPDLIIGHCLSGTSVMLKCALSIRDVPAISILWGTACFTKRLHKPLYRDIFFNNVAALKKLNYIALTFQLIRDIFIGNYGVQQSDFAFAGPPINLAQYTDHIPNTNRPVLFLSKSRGDKFIYEILPKAFKRFPNLIVHAFALEPGVSLAKKYKIQRKIDFHNQVSQQDYANLIKQCNIIYTVTGDSGLGVTAMQASYAGCVNLMKRVSTTSGILSDRVNAIMCESTPADILSKLVYSINNLPTLCREFKANNKHLLAYDQENTWRGFQQAITDCLEGKKGKIVPTCKEAV